MNSILVKPAAILTIKAGVYGIAMSIVKLIKEIFLLYLSTQKTDFSLMEKKKE